MEKDKTITTTVPVVKEFYPYYKEQSKGDKDNYDGNKIKFQPHFYKNGTETTDIKVTNIIAHWKEVQYGQKQHITKVSLKDNKALISIPNKHITTTIKITKIDSESEQPLEGATFGIYNKDNDELVYSSDETGKDGIITFEALRLDEGTYYIKEIKTPEGYKLSEEAQEFTVTKTDTIEFVFKNEKIKSVIPEPEPEPIPEPEPKPDDEQKPQPKPDDIQQVQTGDVVLISIAILLLAIIGYASVVIVSRHSKRKEIEDSKKE